MKKFQPLQDLGQSAADAAEEALVFEAQSMALPDDMGAWLDDTESKIAALRDDHPQKELLNAYLRAAHRHSLAGNDEGVKYHLLLIVRCWNYAGEEAASAGRRKAGSTRGADLKEQGEQTRGKVLELYENSTLPERNRASWIAQKTGLTARRVRDILKEEKKNGNDVR